MTEDDDSSCGSRTTARASPPGARQWIFEDGWSTRPDRGTARRGLGLALVHRLVQRHGGTITVSEGPGAVFTVVLPVPRPAAPRDHRGTVRSEGEPDPDPHPRRRGRLPRQPDPRDYVGRLDGFDVVGQAATVAEAAHRSVATARPTCCCSTSSCPTAPGSTCCAATQPATVPTASRRPRDHRSPRHLLVRAAMKLGAVGYLVKPFTLAALAERLTAYRELRRRMTALDQGGYARPVRRGRPLQRRPPAGNAPVPAKGHSAPTLGAGPHTVRSRRAATCPPPRSPRRPAYPAPPRSATSPTSCARAWPPWNSATAPPAAPSTATARGAEAARCPTVLYLAVEKLDVKRLRRGGWRGAPVPDRAPPVPPSKETPVQQATWDPDSISATRATASGRSSTSSPASPTCPPVPPRASPTSAAAPVTSPR